MEELRDKIKDILDVHAGKAYVSNTQIADLLIEVIRGHKTKQYSECSRCGSTNKNTSLLFHHECRECNLKF